MRVLRTLTMLLAFLLVGCSQTQHATTPEASPAPRLIGNTERQNALPARDISIDGVSILGTWHAVEVVGDAAATTDLELGTMEMTLLVQQSGRSTLTGIDRQEGAGRVSFAGIIEGQRISFDGMDGYGTLSMSGRRLVLRDPRDRRTVYVKGSGN